MKPFEIARVDTVEEQEYQAAIPIEELQCALDIAIELESQSKDEIKRAGWKLVHLSENLQLYKRRDKLKPEEPVEYLMTGAVELWS